MSDQPSSIPSPSALTCQMSKLEIDRDGDVTLKLTKGSIGSEDGIYILVSSKILTLVSRVFSAMLSPRFLEGQRSPSGVLAPIPLPDDDADAMIILCKILHFDPAGLPDSIGLEDFKNLAVLCDKYDCVAPLKFASEHWLLKWEKTTNKKELEIVLFISYVFDRPDRFSFISMRIIREFTGSLNHLETLETFDIIPEELLSMFSRSHFSYKEGFDGRGSIAQENLWSEVEIWRVFRADNITEGLHRQRKLALQKIEAAVTRHMILMEQSSSLSFSDESKEKVCPECWAPAKSRCQHFKATAIYPPCSVESRRGVYVGVLRAALLEPIGLWTTMATKSILDIATCVGNAATSMDNEHSCNGTALADGCPLKSSLGALIAEVDGIKGVATLTRGLCLDCVKASRETTGLDMEKSENVVCRVSHGVRYCKYFIM